MSAITSTERLQRLLALVPYVVSRKVVGLAETAADFGVSERELVDDLNLLWCVELRAPDPYCPIDLSYEGGEIVVSQVESMGRPLRLAVWRKINCASSRVRSRSVSTRDEIPSICRRSTPKRMGPLLLSAQRMCSVQGRVSSSRSPPMAQGDGDFVDRRGAILLLGYYKVPTV